MSTYLLYILILILPSVAGLVIYCARANKIILPVSVALLLISLVAGIYGLVTFAEVASVRFEWLPGLQLGWRIDLISLSLASLVIFISLLVHVFSTFYLEGDKVLRRYYLKLGFFTSAMIGLLGADHLLLLFLFWELVGFFSYLLIGFWFEDEEKASSARNAFITNRIADLGLLIGIFCFWVVKGTFFISEISVATDDLFVFGSFGILIGAMGKSAQFPFHTWLPKAMAGPTPVSALIHAATMVAAGVYLMVRMSEVLPDVVLTTAAIVGGVTALISAFFAMTQYDIKSVLAYSTISQLGYMVMSVGVQASEMAFFHLWTHAFFKAGLFLSAGLIIHNVSHKLGAIDPQDMRNMGGLRKSMPITFWVFTCCMAALIGLPFFTGFLSKDAILSSTLTWANGQQELFWVIPMVAFFSVFLTAYYMTRQWKMIFWGDKDWGKMDEPFVAILPIVFLSIGSIWIWYTWNPLGHDFNIVNWLFPDVLNNHEFGLEAAMASSGLVLLAIFASWKKEHGHIQPNQVVNLSCHGLYLDFIYKRSLVHFYNRASQFAAFCDSKLIDPGINKLATSTVVFSHLTQAFDKYVIDGFVNFVAGFSRFLGNVVKRQQANNWQLQFLWLILLLIAFFWLIIKEF